MRYMLKMPHAIFWGNFLYARYVSLNVMRLILFINLIIPKKKFCKVIKIAVN